MAEPGGIMRDLVLTGVLCIGAFPAPAVAQPFARPPVEVGVDVSAGPGADGDWGSIGPRLGLNFNARTALEISLAPQTSRGSFSSVDYGFVQLKQRLHAFDRAALFGTLGVAPSRQVFSDELARPYPASYPTSYSFGPAFGFGTEVEVGPHLALRAETQYVLSQRSLLRFVGGATVPIGRFPDRSRTADSPELAASPAGLVRIGQTVWVTSSDGREVKGEVVSRTIQGLTMRHPRGAVSVAMPDIRRIEVTDGLGDGIAVGSITGGITGGVLGWIGGLAWCEGEDGCRAFSTLLLGGLGTGIGALAGAVVDSFRDTRRPLFDAARPSAGLRVDLGPVVSSGGAGVSGTIRW